MMDIRPNDRMYNCLRYVPQHRWRRLSLRCWVGGGSVCCASGSPPATSERCHRSRLHALSSSIGELCRYLVSTPYHPRETRHRLRLCCGNDLRADIWEQFAERFKIPQFSSSMRRPRAISRYSIAKEKPGAIGRIPSFPTHRFNVALIRLTLKRS